MTTLTLTDPVNGTVADANTIASNNTAVKAVVNGNIDNANMAAAAAVAVTKLATGGAGQVLGTLAGVNTWLGGLAQIADSTAGASVASIDFTSIPSTYAHLLAFAYLRSDRAAQVFDDVGCRLNNDSAGNYDNQATLASGATASGNEGFAGTSGLYIGTTTAASAPANLFSLHVVFIPYYTNSANNKGCVAINGAKGGTGTGNIFTKTISSYWRSNAAVTRLTFLPVSGPNLIAGSRVTLYGLG